MKIRIYITILRKYLMSLNTNQQIIIYALGLAIILSTGLEMPVIGVGIVCIYSLLALVLNATSTALFKPVLALFAGIIVLSAFNEAELVENISINVFILIAAMLLVLLKDTFLHKYARKN